MADPPQRTISTDPDAAGRSEFEGARALQHPRLALARLERLVARAESLRAGGMPFDELRELSALYRSQSARLSRMRDRAADPDAIRHLNGLCVRAYAFLYSSGGPTGGSSERTRWAPALPALVARAWRAIALAWILLFLGAALGGAMTAREPEALYALLPVGFGYTADRVDRLWSSEKARADFLARDETPVGTNLLFGSRLFAHNTRIGVLAFATGILAGVPTVVLQLYNGLMLGAFTSVFLRDPWPVAFAAWLLPHGVPELTAITLCCAAGLILGSAVAAPGRRRRSAALREDSLPALVLVGLSVPLFLLAALTESFVRESALGTGTRLGVAAFYAVALAAAHLALRRLARRERRDTDWLLDVAPPAQTSP